MNHFSIQQNAFVTREEIRGSAFVSDAKDPVLCPKPRRVGILANNSMRPLRLQINSQFEVFDSKAGSELLDIILKKDQGLEQPMDTSSPPFFCGSPPSRAANPLVHDARFGGEKLASFPAFPFPSPSEISSPTSSARNGGCARMNFGLKPATVRVEGFDCLNRDRQNSRIPAMA